MNFSGFHTVVPVLVLLGAAVSAQADDPSLTFIPMVPCRAVDTRQASGTFGGPDMVGGSRDFPLQSSSCNIPSTAVAYSLNVTAVPKEVLGFLSIYPTGQNQPSASTLNSWEGGAVANSAIVAGGTNGSVTVFVSEESDVILDVNGYFIPAPVYQGAVGPAGPAGAAGPQGPAGPAGPVGAAGATGATGATGTIGPQGPAGPTGPAGPIGPIGLTGPIGPMGLTGPAGSQGATGATGAQGPAVFTASIPTLSNAIAPQYAAITGLNQTTVSSGSIPTVTAITGLACSSETLTVVRTGASVFDQTRVYLYVNGVEDDNLACVSDGGVNCSASESRILNPTDTLYYLTGFWGDPGTGGEYIALTCNPSPLM